MSFRKSIRWRIQSWHGLLLLAMTLGFGITVYRLEKTNVLRNADQELRVRIGVLGNMLDRGGRGGPDGRRDGPGPEGGRRGPPRPPWDPGSPGGGDRPREAGRLPGLDSTEMLRLFKGASGNGFYHVIWSRDGQSIISTGDAPPGVALPGKPDTGGMEPVVRVRDGWRECYLFTPRGECLLVGTGTEALEAELRGFAWRTGLAGLGVTAAGLAIGWWISTRALRPIAQISAAATRIAGGRLDERIHTEETESELGKLAAVLDGTFQRLDAAFAEQARFTSDAAHELRTPVSIILAQTQLALSKERTAEAYRQTIEISRRAALRMQDLTEALLQLAVLDGQDRVELSRCDLGEIAEDQAGLARPLAEGKGILLEVEPGEAACLGNAPQIGQVVLNLLSNAIKFTQAGGRITIRTSSADGRAVLSVGDNGPGIPAEHLPHLFDRFYRADASRSREKGGAGLGLAICRRIAEAHGGTLEVASTVGRGSVFTLRLTGC